MSKFYVRLCNSVYLEREVEAADEEEARVIAEGDDYPLPSVMEAWARGEIETGLFGWEAYDIEEIEAEPVAALPPAPQDDTLEASR